jgi:hypothetical protein
MNVRKTDDFIADSERQFEWYTIHAGWSVADRYLDAVESTCARSLDVTAPVCGENGRGAQADGLGVDPALDLSPGSRASSTDHGGLTR